MEKRDNAAKKGNAHCIKRRIKEGEKILDQVIFSAINRLAGASSILDWTGIIITNFGVAFLALLILVTRKKRVIFNGLISFLLSLGVELSIKQIFQMPRPDANALVTVTNSSFPSGHSANAFALAMTLYFYDRRIGIPALIFAAIIGVSRIFVGVHWPSDVIVGAVIGVGVAYAVNRMLENHKKKSQKRQEIN